MNTPRRLRVLVADRDRRVRRALRELLSAQTDLEVCAEAGTTDAALARVSTERPDVVLLDVLLPGRVEGLNLVAALERQGVPAVVLTTAASLRRPALENGACAFLEKDGNLHRIPQALREASHCCPAASSVPITAAASARTLTDRSRQGGKKHVNSNYDGYLQTATQLQRWRDFQAHVFAYLVINLAFVLIWALDGQGFFWPVFSLVGWAIGLSFQHFSMVLRGQITDEQVRRKLRPGAAGPPD